MKFSYAIQPIRYLIEVTRHYGPQMDKDQTALDKIMGQNPIRSGNGTNPRCEASSVYQYATRQLRDKHLKKIQAIHRQGTKTGKALIVKVTPIDDSSPPKKKRPLPLLATKWEDIDPIFGI